MTPLLKHKPTLGSIPHFKERPLAQLMTLTLSLAGYGIINSRAHADQLPCDVTGSIDLIVDATNDVVCTIEGSGSVTINTNSTLTNNNSLRNNGSLRNYDSLGNTGILRNSGTLTNTGTLTNDNALVNTGTLNNDGTLGNAGTLNNSGTLTNAGAISNENGRITNSGTFDITETGTLFNDGGQFTQTAGSTIVNGEFLGGDVDIQGGSVSGSGTIDADSITIGENATVNPGNSPGTLIMIGDVSLFGTLITEIQTSLIFDVLDP